MQLTRLSVAQIFLTPPMAIYKFGAATDGAIQVQKKIKKSDDNK